MNSELVNALQNQFNRERQNGALYDALAGCFAYMNLEGFEKFCHANAAEEREHARKFFDHLNQWGEMPRVDGLSAEMPPLGGGVFVDTFALIQAAYSAETQNQIALEALALTAEANNDQTCEAFLNPILIDQLASIHEFDMLLTKLRIAQGDGSAILILNAALGG